MQNIFLRVPEFIEYYRNLSSLASKSLEDPNLMHLVRPLVGLYDLLENQGCNFTLPSEGKVREILDIAFQQRKIDIILIKGIVGC